MWLNSHKTKFVNVGIFLLYLPFDYCDGNVKLKKVLKKYYKQYKIALIIKIGLYSITVLYS